MPGFTESSITLNFPDNNFFRFADCDGYRTFAGFHFKEMDACWFDEANNLCWLIELKDFTKADLSNEDNIAKRSWDIAKKAYDTICMFLSIKHSYEYGTTQLDQCLPFSINAETKFKVVTIVHAATAQKAEVQLLHEQFRIKFKPYALLFDIGHYGIIEHSKAIANIPYGIVS